MKKVIIPLAVIAAVVIGVLVYFNVRKDKQAEAENQQAATEAEIDFAELLSSRGIEQPIQLLNSEAIVHIEGISEEEANSINEALRQYESAMGSEVDESSEQAYLYTEIGPALASWFDPSIDTVAEFKATSHDTTGPNAWLTNPLEAALAREDCANAFYFKQNADGSYVMSYGYYMVGLAHSEAWRLVQAQ